MIRMFESSTAWPQEEARALAEFRPPEPPEIEVDLDAGRMTVTDHDEVVEYELAFGHGAGTACGCRWLERTHDRDGRPVETAVTTAEVMAVLRDIGREEDAARITLATAAWFEASGDWKAGRTAARLRAEVACRTQHGAAVAAADPGATRRGADDL